MLIRQLEYLVALAHEKHFARAAERCGVSQPALSLAVKQIETDLGVAIVTRGNRFHGFTSEGELVLKWARGILRDEGTLRQELRLRSSALAGALRLGVIPSATATSSYLATSFAREHSDVSISEVEMTSVDILRAIAEFEIDGGITYTDNEPLGHVRVSPLGVEQYVLVTPDADAGTAASGSVSWKDAAALPLCLLDRTMQNRRIVDAVFESVGTQPNARIETNSMMSIYCYLRSGTWSSVMPRSFVEWLAPPPGLRVTPLVEPFVTKAIGLVVADRDPIPPLLAAFRAHVEAEAGKPAPGEES